MPTRSQLQANELLSPHLRSCMWSRVYIYKYMYVVFLGLFSGLLYYQCGNNQASIFIRIGFIFFMIAMQSLVTLFSSVLTCNQHTQPHMHTQVRVTLTHYVTL